MEPHARDQDVARREAEAGQEADEHSEHTEFNILDVVLERAEGGIGRADASEKKQSTEQHGVNANRGSSAEISMPGAYGVTPTPFETMTEDLERSLSGTSSLVEEEQLEFNEGSALLVEAQLVDEAREEKEIDRLKSELEELKRTSQNRSAEIVMAEPLSTQDSEALSPFGSMAMTLDFSSLPLIGRSNELNTLLKAYNKSTSEQAHTVMVHGYAGVGKTALLRRFASLIVEQGRGCRCVSGKFDPLVGACTKAPYQPLIDACNELVEMILQSPAEELNATRELLARALPATDAHVLVEVFPSLRGLFNFLCLPTPPSSSAHNGPISHLMVCFRTFVRLVSTSAHPLVFFIEDLQWGDQASLSLCKALSSDPHLKHFLLVGSYRENEVPPPLFSHLQDLAENEAAKVTDISIDNLNRSSVNIMLSSALSLGSTKTKSLSNFLYDKTHGNPFFLVQMLRTLQERQILLYSPQDFKWTWDPDRIQSWLKVGDNVTRCVDDRIQQFPAKVGLVLQLAASLGSEFDLETISAVVELPSSELPFLEALSENHNHNTRAQQVDLTLQECLDEAVQSGLLLRSQGNNKYQFSHEGLRERAYSLIPEGRVRGRLHWRIGEILLRKMDVSPEVDHTALFHTTDQFNRGSPPDCPCGENSKIQVAELNLQAGKAAMTLCAFQPAADYIRAGINLCGDDRWTSQYDLCLRLYQKLAPLNLWAGKHKECRILIWELLEFAQHLEDKIPSLFTLYDSYATEGKLQEAADTSQKILLDLGETTLRRVTTIRPLKRAILQTKRSLKGKTDAEILSLPTMTNNYKEASMRALIASIFIEFHLERMDSLHYLMTQGLFLEYGVCKYTTTALVLYGVLLILEGEVDEGHGVAMLGRKLGEERFPEDVDALAWTNVFFYGLADHWKRPLHLGLKGLHNAYEVSLIRVGATDQSGMNLTGYFISYFYGGFKLEPFLKDLQKFAAQLLDYGQKNIFMMLVPYWQCTLNLMGKSEDPLELNVGEAIEYARRVQKNNAYQLGGTAMKSFLLQLAYYFGDLDMAYKMSCELEQGASLAITSASFFIGTRKFFFCLVCLALARKTQGRKYMKQARKYFSWFKSKSRRGAVNLVHKTLTLQAEFSSLQKSICGKKDVEWVKQAYDDAIQASKRSGFLQDHALANELAGEFFLSLPDKDHTFLAACYLNNAVKSYIDWGAHAKASQLREKHGLDASDISCDRHFNPSTYRGSVERFKPLSSMESIDTLSFQASS